MMGLNSMAWLALLVWVGVPLLVIWMVFKLPQRVKTKLQKSLLVVAILGVMFGPWLISNGVKWYYDQQVLELCAKDGGVKVYETVALPKERFNQWGQILIPDIKNYAHLNDEYYYESFPSQLIYGNPEVYRLHEKVYRKLDYKLLGETISYARRGGDLPGPWIASFYRCPSDSDITDLNKQIFKMN